MSYCSADPTFTHVFSVIAVSPARQLQCHAYLARRQRIVRGNTTIGSTQNNYILSGCRRKGKQIIKLNDELNEIGAEDPIDKVVKDSSSDNEQNPWFKHGNRNLFPRYINQTKDISKEEFNCTKCDFQSNKKVILRNHMNLKHTKDALNKEKSTKCRNCKEIFQSKVNLK